MKSNPEHQSTQGPRPQKLDSKRTKRQENLQASEAQVPVQKRGQQPAWPDMQQRYGGRPKIYPKLSIGAVNDPAEQEADRAAEQVMQGGSILVPEAQPKAEKPGALRMKAGAGAQGGMDAPASIESKISGKRGKGAKLPETTQSKLEQSFGTDFSGMNIHTDAESASMNREIGAKAFTQGNDVFFGAGQYQPGTQEGERLIAHEAAHVVQEDGVVRREMGEEEQGGGDEINPYEKNIEAAITYIYNQYALNVNAWLLKANKVPFKAAPFLFEVTLSMFASGLGGILAKSLSNALTKVNQYGRAFIEQSSKKGLEISVTTFGNKLVGLGIYNLVDNEVTANFQKALITLTGEDPAEKDLTIATRDETLQSRYAGLSEAEVYAQSILHMIEELRYKASTDDFWSYCRQYDLETVSLIYDLQKSEVINTIPEYFTLMTKVYFEHLDKAYVSGKLEEHENKPEKLISEDSGILEGNDTWGGVRQGGIRIKNYGFNAFNDKLNGYTGGMNDQLAYHLKDLPIKDLPGTLYFELKHSQLDHAFRHPSVLCFVRDSEGRIWVDWDRNWANDWYEGYDGGRNYLAGYAEQQGADPSLAWEEKVRFGAYKLYEKFKNDKLESLKESL